MSYRRPRSKPFLDDPDAYPEYSLLIERQSLHQSLICRLHRHRMASMLAIIGVSVAVSGAAMPALPWNLNGEPAGTPAEWSTYLMKGLALELLSKHFAGIVSALSCIALMTAASLTVYPLRAWVTRTWLARGDKLDGGTSTLLTIAAGLVAVGLPSATSWGLAVWGAGRFRWGVSAGLCVGLHYVALTLKSWSFFQVMGLNKVRASPGKVAAGANGRANAPTATVSSTTPEIIKDKGNEDNLTFSEFVRFVLVAPSLVCEPHLLRHSAQVPSNMGAAVSQLFHAALTYLAVHTYAVALFAPALRVLLAAQNSSSWEAFDDEVFRQGQGSGGGWLTSIVCPQAAGEAESGGGGGEYGSAFPQLCLESDPTVRRFLMVAVAGVSGSILWSTMMHFLMFYAFFHCICVGVAEFWGYPDRNLYGPWWLVRDDIRDYFRMWSAPVHRWLMACVQQPLLNAGRVSPKARCALEQQSRPPLPERVSSALTSSGDHSNSIDVRGGSSVGGGGAREGGKSCTVATATKNRCPLWWSVITITCVFFVSGVIHEAVGFVAMRRTFRPINTMMLIVTASLTPYWDILFPVHARSELTKSAGSPVKSGEQNAKNKTETQSVGAARDVLGPSANGSNVVATDGVYTKPISGAHRRSRKVIGSWRGWFAVWIYVTTHYPLTLFFDFLCWQWWRFAHDSQ